MAVLMITHDLGVVANIADEVVVMYHGKMMERGPLDDIFPARAPLPEGAAARRAALRTWSRASAWCRSARSRRRFAAAALLKRRAPSAPGPSPDARRRRPAGAAEGRGVTKRFRSARPRLVRGGQRARGVVRAVDDVSFDDRGAASASAWSARAAAARPRCRKIIMRALDARPPGVDHLRRPRPSDRRAGAARRRS